MLNIFKKKPVDPKQQMREVLGDYQLPSFPVVIMSALEKVRDADAPQAQIAELVASDPGLSVKLLTTVNSAAYSLKHKVNNIDHAVSLMGRSELESILISMAVHQLLPVDTDALFDGKNFWRIAARRAALARVLADHIDPSNRSESFTAALLQDMAIPVLAQQRAQEYGPVLEYWYETGADLASLEREKFGWDHAVVAMWMCDDWGFPTAISEAIGAHHGSDGELVALPAVSLVSSLSGQDSTDGIDILIQRAHEEYGLPKEQLAELVESSMSAAEEISQMFS